MQGGASTVVGVRLGLVFDDLLDAGEVYWLRRFDLHALTHIAFVQAAIRMAGEWKPQHAYDRSCGEVRQRIVRRYSGRAANLAKM